jgi:hypothetical protein
MKNSIIFSVYQKNLPDSTNAENHRKTLVFLLEQGLKPKTIVGQYKGTKELSIAIDYNIDTSLIVDELSKTFNQESVLFIKNEIASLKYTYSNIHEELGKLIISDTKPNSDSWSYDLNTQTFFCIG